MCARQAVEFVVSESFGAPRIPVVGDGADVQVPEVAEVEAQGSSRRRRSGHAGGRQPVVVGSRADDPRKAPRNLSIDDAPERSLRSIGGGKRVVDAIRQVFRGQRSACRPEVGTAKTPAW